MYEKYLGRVRQGLDERAGEDVLAFGLFVPRGSMMMLASPALCTTRCLRSCTRRSDQR